MSNPSPIEVRQAALLAHALDRGPGHDWSKVDDDVREAVYALRPELAPPLREGLLDEALAEILDGPLAAEPTAEELEEARALAEALDAPTPTLDPDISDAIYALSPGRARAPNVSIDDILDSVATGPFAPVIRITGEFPAEIAPPTNLRERSTEDIEPAEVVSLASRRPKPRPVPAPELARRGRWWLPAAGVLAAAAATMLFVVPTLSMNESAPMPAMQGTPVATESSAASAEPADMSDAKREAPRASAKKRPPEPSSAPRAEPAKAESKPDMDSIKDLPPSRDQWAEDEPGQEEKSTESRNADKAPASGRSAGPVQQPAPAPPREPAPADATVSRSAPQTNTGDLEALGYLDDIAGKEANSGYGGLANTGGEWAGADLEDADDVVADALDEVDANEPPPAAPAADYRYDNTGVEAERAEEEESMGWAVSADSPAAGSASLGDEDGRSESDSFDTLESVAIAAKRKVRERSRSTASSPATASAEPMEPEGSVAAPSLGLLDPSLYSAHPNHHNDWTLARQLEDRGDLVGAARLLSNLANTARSPDVIVDAAVRSGRLWLAVGNPDQARVVYNRARSVHPNSSRLRAARTDLGRQIELSSPPAADPTNQ